MPHGCSCGPDPDELPVPLLVARVDMPGDPSSLLGLTVDYEASLWRGPQLASHLLEWVTDFALRHSERYGITHGRAVEVIRSAMKRTFGNGNDRGLPGEILLHLACRQFYGSDTVINKIFFKTSNNDTVKGFDAVHVVHGEDGLELWLGEAKFYADLKDAIRSVVAELAVHLSADYMKDERPLISGKIEDGHPHAGELRDLLHHNTPLDEVFARMTVPVLLTYDSEVTGSFTNVCDEYLEGLKAEMEEGLAYFHQRVSSDLPVTIRLILVPLSTKEALTEALKQELNRWL